MRAKGDRCSSRIVTGPSVAAGWSRARDPVPAGWWVRCGGPPRADGPGEAPASATTADVSGVTMGVLFFSLAQSAVIGAFLLGLIAWSGRIVPSGPAVRVAVAMVALCALG